MEFSAVCHSILLRCKHFPKLPVLKHSLCSSLNIIDPSFIYKTTDKIVTLYILTFKS
jgi:hypothetical protein